MSETPKEKTAKAHDVEALSISGTALRLRVDGVDGVEHDINLACHSRLLANATPEQISDFTLSPSGFGIHWPRIDEDLSIDGLIRGKGCADQAVTHPSTENG